MLLYNYVTISEREEVTRERKKRHVMRKYIVFTLHLVLLGLLYEGDEMSGSCSASDGR
jgi:hypothetical protein